METSLHQQLKLVYAKDIGQTEVRLSGYRIDAIGQRGELVEIQHASLGAIREKTRRLLAIQRKRVRIVKPIVARKWLTTLDQPGGQVLRKRLSPKRGDALDIFMDLVHFGDVFPHSRLTLEIALVDIEEVRVDRPQRRFRGKRHKTLDQRLIDVSSRIELVKLSDLLDHLPLMQLPEEFDTGQLADSMERPRWFAQKVTYCLRNSRAIELIGKRGRSQLYRLLPIRGRKRTA